KYPSIEKLAGMARALNTNIENLVSVKTGRNLHPLLKFLESDLVKKLPLDLFGLSEHDMIDLMATAPEKFANFLVTVLEVSRSYDMKLDDLYQGALRSYIESHDNYFPEVESRARELKAKLFPAQDPSAQQLQQVLERDYRYRIEAG